MFPKAVIFDMDGTLIDSEPFWQKAEYLVFSNLGVKVEPELTLVTAGMTTRAVTEFWYEKYPWKGVGFEEVEYGVVKAVAKEITNQGRGMSGAVELVRFLQEKGIKLALATNSPKELVPLVLRRLEIENCFSVISTVNDVEKGKPDPAIYELALQRLGCNAEQCLVFEDSETGVKAAKAAGLKVVLISESTSKGLADLQMTSLDKFHNAMSDHLKQLFG